MSTYLKPESTAIYNRLICILLQATLTLNPDVNLFAIASSIFATPAPTSLNSGLTRLIDVVTTIATGDFVLLPTPGYDSEGSGSLLHGGKSSWGGGMTYSKSHHGLSNCRMIGACFQSRCTLDFYDA